MSSALSAPVCPSSPRSSAPGSSRATTTAPSWPWPPTARSTGRSARSSPRCCRGRATSRSRPSRWSSSASTCPTGPARAGLRLALRRALPRRGRTPHAGVRRARRVRAPDARRTTRSTTTPARPSSAPGGAKAPILMNCSGKHAAMLATCVLQGLGHRHLPRPRPPAPGRDRRHLRPAHGRADRRGRRRRLRCAAAVHVAHRAGAGLRVPRHRDRRAERRVADAIRAPPRVRQRHHPRRARPAPGRPRADRQGRRRVLLRRRAPRRARLGAQDRRRGRARTPGADGRGAAPLGRARRGRRRRRGGPLNGAVRAPRWRTAGRGDPRAPSEALPASGRILVTSSARSAPTSMPRVLATTSALVACRASSATACTTSTSERRHEADRRPVAPRRSRPQQAAQQAERDERRPR